MFSSVKCFAFYLPAFKNFFLSAFSSLNMAYPILFFIFGMYDRLIFIHKTSVFFYELSSLFVSVCSVFCSIYKLTNSFFICFHPGNKDINVFFFHLCYYVLFFSIFCILVPIVSISLMELLFVYACCSSFPIDTETMYCSYF